MDAAGAAGLHWRIQQQQHWRQAQAVLDGRQPTTDPDSEDLETVGDGIRIYSARFTAEGRLRICKRLVDGVWEHGTLEDDSVIAGELVSAQPPGYSNGSDFAHVA
jgi:hypothetical protein